MEFGVREYIAIGFPLLVGFLLAVLFPLRLKDYFSKEETLSLRKEPLPSKIGLKDLAYIFVIYTVSTVVLGLAQAYLFWRFAVDPDVRFATRFTDFIFYPFIVSACMAVFMMWFIFSYRVFSKGAEAVRQFLSTSYDGWGISREVGRFKYLVLIAALLCTAANFWTYNIFLMVTDDAIEVSNHAMLGRYKFGYDRIDYFRIEWHRNEYKGKKYESFVLSFKLHDGGIVRTDLNMLYSKNMLHQIDQIIDSSNEASGQYFEVFFSEFPRTETSEIRSLLSKE